MQEMNLIRNETIATKHRSEELTVEYEQLLVDVEAIERRLQALEKQAEEDALLAQEVLIIAYF